MGKVVVKLLGIPLGVVVGTVLAVLFILPGGRPFGLMDPRGRALVLC
jgi:hypothetical protein